MKRLKVVQRLASKPRIKGGEELKLPKGSTKVSNKTHIETQVEAIKKRFKVYRKKRSPDGLTVNWDSFGDQLGKAVPENLFKSKVRYKRPKPKTVFGTR